ncbi:hypothetical protein FACS189418_6850 [Clostridia bacterium]|nr:hypothetical protein FACS189418_6850 [Clostridia bacterium]
MHNVLLDEREQRYEIRKAAKKLYDQVYTLRETAPKNKATFSIQREIKAGGCVRLLDEGAVIDAEGGIRCYIKKGTIDQYFSALSDQFIGTVDIGHLSFSTFPFIVGEFSKQDLKVVDIGNGRKALDLYLHLDSDSVFIKELSRVNYTIGISAEFYYSVDEIESEKNNFLVIDAIDIFAVGLVGEAGNVNSGGLKVKKNSFLESLFVSKKEGAKPEEVKKEVENLTAEELLTQLVDQCEKLQVECTNLQEENTKLKEQLGDKDQTEKNIEKLQERIDKLLNGSTIHLSHEEDKENWAKQFKLFD